MTRDVFGFLWKRGITHAIPDNLLINGKGRIEAFDSNGKVATPTAVFEIASGIRLGMPHSHYGKL